MARVALACNLIRPGLLARGRPLDAVAELDTEETLAAVEAALRAGGHEVVRVEADAEVAAALAAAKPDVVFNMAEGVGGESRESLVPAVCEALGLPYTGSGVLTTALCLDKPRAKETLAAHGVATPAGQSLERADAPLAPALRYPLIVKLAREGSSMGLTADSVVDDAAAVRRRAGALLATYGGPVLVEEFIEGREFTVGVLGNAEPTPLPIVELTFAHSRGINLFEPDAALLALAAAAGVPAPPVTDGHGTRCPAPVDAALAARIEATTVRAFRALGCRDWGRVDLRLAADGALYVLDVNPIAGLDPTYLLPRAAAAGGLTYAALINRILDLALARARECR